LDLVLPIAPSPIGDAYVPADRLDEQQELYPLDVYLCQDCAHAQNVDVVDPEILFRDYIYVTASSLGLVEHFRRYADDVSDRFSIGSGSFVVEIGSNDGSLLRFFKAKGARVLGIDPAREIAKATSSSGIPTLPEFFSKKLAEEISRKDGRASLIVANNVFAHADDLRDVVAGIEQLLDDQGIFVFEVSYLVDMVDGLVFDTIYHEHVSYHTIVPLQKLFDSLGMMLFDVRRIESKGGSIRGFAAKRTSHRAIEPVVDEMARTEGERGFGKRDIFKRYSLEIDKRKFETTSIIDAALQQGKIVAGYGASTTVATLMWHFGLQSKLSYLFDDNPRKHGLFSPRNHLPVYPSGQIYDLRPDLIVILAWTYAKPIVARHNRYLSNGGQFLVPLPEVQIVKGT
jgi:SAM-dependent methyltransferase